MIVPIPLFDNNQTDQVSLFVKPTTKVETSVVNKAPEDVVYTVQPNDTLESIATANNTTVQRLFNKNANINDPNLINVGQTIVIPSQDEKLDDRTMPVYTVSQSPVAVMGRASVSGNGYVPGNCTWYVKNMRPDLPNDLGNASSWWYSAARYGYAEGYEPRVGAVAAAIGYNHVAIVTSVYGDGTIQISEMNSQGLGVISTRRTPISEFRYIY